MKIILSIYVNCIVFLIRAILFPINKLMRHILIVRGIDPKTEPGAELRKQLIEAFSSIKENTQYDSDVSDINFNEMHRRFIDFRKKSNKEIDEQTYKNMTDLDNLTSELDVVKAIPKVKKIIKPKSKKAVKPKKDFDIEMKSLLSEIDALKSPIVLKKLREHLTKSSDVDSAVYEKIVDDFLKEKAAQKKSRAVFKRTAVDKKD